MATVEWTKPCRRCGGVCVAEERRGQWRQAGCMFCGLLDCWTAQGIEEHGVGGLGTVHTQRKRYGTRDQGSTKLALDRATRDLKAKVSQRRKALRSHANRAAIVIRLVRPGIWSTTTYRLGKPPVSVEQPRRVAQRCLGLHFGRDEEPTTAWRAWSSNPLHGWRMREATARVRRVMINFEGDQG